MLGDSAIALEWLDITLAEVKYQPDMRTYSIVRESLKTALSSCIALDEKKYINTGTAPRLTSMMSLHPLIKSDHKPRNILLSDIETSRITAKVGDLGLGEQALIIPVCVRGRHAFTKTPTVFPVGDRIKVQPYAMRAPEVFLGQACTGPSQVWAIAAMLLCWIKPGVLGAGDSPHFLINEAWSMAKIKRLFPEWNVRAPDEGANHSLQVAVKSANRMSREEPVMQAILPFKEETQKIEVAQPLRDLLHLMLVVNLEDRPSGSSTLASAEFLAFEKFVDAQ